MSASRIRLWSLSVGIDRYKDPQVSTLQYAVADARAFHDAIAKTFDTTVAESSLLTDEQATLREFRSAIGEGLARAAATDDIVIIFFAGHGSPETSADVDNASRYLVMHDTEFDSIFATGVDLERDFVRLLERIPAKRVLVFLDCCFSGKAGGRTFEGPTLLRRRQEFRGHAIDLDKLELGEGRVVISACDDWQVAREEPEVAHGIFTFHLLSVLTRDAADGPTISVLRLYEEVASEVARHTYGKQYPVLNGRARLFHLPRFKPT